MAIWLKDHYGRRRQAYWVARELGGNVAWVVGAVHRKLLSLTFVPGFGAEAEGFCDDLGQ